MLSAVTLCSIQKLCLPLKCIYKVFLRYGFEHDCQVVLYDCISFHRPEVQDLCLKELRKYHYTKHILVKHLSPVVKSTNQQIIPSGIKTWSTGPSFYKP